MKLGISDWRPILYNIVLLGFLGLLAWGLCKTPQWDWPHLVVCIVAAGFVALLGNMDRLESFKAGAGGIEAKTRQVVERAENTLTELQVMAESFGVVLFELIDGGGRWGGGHSAPERDMRKREIRDLLKRIGLTDDRIKAVAAAERRWALVDYVNGLGDRLPLDPTNNAEWSKAWAPWNDTLERPDPDTLKAMLEIAGSLSPWRGELLEDYRHYWKTSEHRRPSIWTERDEWHVWTANDSWPNRAR